MPKRNFAGEEGFQNKFDTPSFLPLPAILKSTLLQLSYQIVLLIVEDVLDIAKKMKETI